jgi:hypothetical protein
MTHTDPTHPTANELMAWRDGELDDASAGAVRAHVARCAACAAEVDRFGATSRALAAWTVEAAPARARVARVPVPATAPPPRRRGLVYFGVAAAAVFLFVLTTVRVECSPAPTCDVRRWHFVFFPVAHEDGAAVATPGRETAETRRLRDFWLAQRSVPMGVDRDGARVVVVMFIDWECPACRTAHLTYLPEIAELNRVDPGSVRVIERDFPLNSRCNPNIPVELHRAACEAAVAVRLAREHGRAAEMIAWLLTRQGAVSPADVRDAARDVGGVLDFDARYEAVLTDVAADVEAGRRLEVLSTPTVFVNGRLARGSDGRLFTAGELRAAIEIEGR